MMVEEQQSILSWLIHSAGLFGLLVVLSSLVVSIGALIVVVASRRPGLIAACFPWLLLPLGLACFGMIWGSVQSFMVIASSEVAPKPKDLAEGVSVALVCPLLALALTFPGYLVLSIGLFLRTLAAGKQSSP
jgi:hypothetical protein